jgi:type I restriction enzyme S subunit
MITAQKTKIINHCEITSSKRVFAHEYLDSGVPFYRGKEISEKQRSPNEINDQIFISREKFNEIKSKYGAPIKGDLLLTSVGTIGNPYLVKEGEEFYFKDGNLTWFRNFKDLNSQWLYYWLLSPQGKKELNKCTIGASQKAYTINLLEGMEFDLLPFPTQNQIASVLSAYDDLIENNEKRIKALEEMAELLYTEWFVKFKFPGHEKIKLVDSGTSYGKIPEGWKASKLADILQNTRNSTRAGEHLSSRQYIPIENITRKSFILREHTSWQEAQSSLILFNKGDILFGAMRPYFHKVAIAMEPGVTRTTCLVLKPKDSYLKSFGLMTVFSDRFVSFASSNTQGATIPYAVWENSLENFPILIPSKQILEGFENIVAGFIAEENNLAQRNINLSKLRDLLIPQLVTGKRELKNI